MPLCKLLQRSPSARYQTAGELATDLRGRLGAGYGMSEAAEETARAVRDADDEWLDLERVSRPSEASA